MGSMTENVCAEMSANVWQIVVSVGDQVSEGDPLMILESMKMEIPVLADEGGTVVAIHVAEGETVQPGQTLADLQLS